MAAGPSTLVVRLRGIAAAAICALNLARPAEAQAPPLGPIVPTWAPNGTVDALAIDGTTLYVGGTFDYVGPPTGSMAIVDATDPTAINTQAHLLDTVEGIVSDGAGGWYVASPPYLSQPRLIHILPSGLPDLAWTSPVLSGAVSGLAIDGGRLFVSGFLTAVNGVPRAGIAALDAATGALLPWDAQLVYSPGGAIVRSTAIAGGRVYVAGAFTDVHGLPRAGFAVLDAATGAVLPITLPDPATLGVTEVGASTGRVYVSAFFTSDQPTLRAYDLDMVPLPSWTAPPPSMLLLATPSAVFNAVAVVGLRLRVEALDPSTGSPLPFAPVELRRDTDPTWVAALALAHGRLYIGGGFETVNGLYRPHFAAVDATTGAPVAWDTRVGGTVNAVAVDGGRVAVGGGFQSIGGIAKRNLVTIDLATGRPATPAAPDLAFSVRALHRLGDVVVVGGERDVLASPPTPNLVAYLRTTGALLPWSLSADSTVTVLTSNGRELFIGGRFSSLSGQPRPYLASVDLQTAALTSWTPGLDNAVDRLVVEGDTLYALGSFGRVGTEPRFRLAAFDTASRTLLPFSAAPGELADVAVHRDRLLLSGTFYPPGAGPVAFRWVDRVSGADVPPATDAAVFGGRLAPAGATIYALAATVIGGPYQLLAIDGATGQAAVFDPPRGLNGSLAASDEYLAVGAYRTTPGALEQSLAVFRTPRAGAPRGLTANVSGSTVTLGWRAGPPPATTSFVVEAGTTPGGVEVGAFPVGLATQASGAVSPGTYRVRVRSVGANGPGAASSDAVLTIPAPSAPPGAPGALTGSVANRIVSLSWGVAAGNATTYAIEAGTAPGLANLVVFATGTLDTTFVAPAPPGTYYVRVRAANAFGVSSPTNDVTLVVP